ncbi:hypothetical protein LXL04_024877 [Taraxacum kok-saghyz]
MTDKFPVSGLDHEQVKSKDELPPETAWLEEHDCVPLKQQLKMLRVRFSTSPVDDSIKIDDDLCDSLGFYSDYDGNEGRSDDALSEQIQHDTLHSVGSSPIQDRLQSEILEKEYNDDIENSEEFLEDLDHVVLKERQRMLLSREPVGCSRASDVSGISSPIRRGNDIDETHDQSVHASINESQNYKNVKLEPRDDDLQSPSKAVSVTMSTCLNSQIFIKNESVQVYSVNLFFRFTV